MMTAGVVIDGYKLKTFKKVLDDGGFKYTEHNGPIKGCITLSVETDDIQKLQPYIEAAQKKCLN